MIGTALRDARRAAGLQQEELARRAGVSRMTVQRLEAGTIGQPAGVAAPPSIVDTLATRAKRRR